MCILAMDNISESALLTKSTFPFLVFAILTTSLAMNHKRFVTSEQAAANHRFMWEAAPPLTSR
jgi:hypothetical protein